MYNHCNNPAGLALGLCNKPERAMLLQHFALAMSWQSVSIRYTSQCSLDAASCSFLFWVCCVCHVQIHLSSGYGLFG